MEEPLATFSLYDDFKNVCSLQRSKDEDKKIYIN